MVLGKATERLQIESILSKKALETGENIKEQKLILETWKDWYLKALDSIDDLSSTPNQELKMSISLAKQKLEGIYQTLLQVL